MKILRKYTNLLPFSPDCHFYPLREYDWSIMLRWNIEISGTRIMAWNETFVKIMYVKHKKRDWTVTFISWKSRNVLSYNGLFQITDRTVCWNIAGFSVDIMFVARRSKSVFTQSPLLLMSTLFLPQWDIMWNDMLSLSSLIW